MVAAVAILGVGGWYGYRYMESRLAGSEEKNQEAAQQPAAGTQPGQTIATKSAEVKAAPPLDKQLRDLFSARYGVDAADIVVTVENEQGDFVRGRVNLGQGGVTDDEGFFLAKKIEGTWKLIQHGNAVIFCDHVRPFEFPQDMVADCILRQEITAKKGETIPFVFNAQKDSGYQWEASFNEKQLKLMDKAYDQEYVDIKGDPINGGSETFQFEVLGDGPIDIHFFTIKNALDITSLEQQFYRVVTQ